MTTFNLPSSSPSRGQRHAFGGFSTWLQGGRIPLLLTGLPGRFAGIPCIPAQILRERRQRLRSPQYPGVQGLWKQGHSRRLRPADDERYGDSTPVHQPTARAPIFSPEPWDSGQRPLGREGPWTASHQCSATSRRSRASRHIPSAPPARGDEKNQRVARLKNRDEWHVGCQTALSAGLSSGSRCGVHTRFRQTPAERATVLRRATTRPIIPRTEDVVFCSYQAKVRIFCDDVKLR